MDRKKKQQLKNTILASVLLISLIATIITFYIKHSDLLEKKLKPVEFSFNQKPILNLKEAKEVRGQYISSKSDFTIYSKPFKVRGIYIAPSVVPDEERLDELVEYAHRNNINSFVIDLKSDYGFVVYNSEIREVQESGANENVYITDIKALVKKLDDNNIYPIARIVCFKDGVAGNDNSIAINQKDGRVWKDRSGMTWLNPYNDKAQDYLLSVIKEAVVLGFKDIQLDYVRFPSEGNMSTINYGEHHYNSKSEAITSFIKKAREATGSCEFSIDSFGMITTVRGDLGIGQDLHDLLKVSDVVCPMIYPSHYTRGNFNLDYPDAHPYEVVYSAMKDALKRLDENEDEARYRPWIQSFTAGWLKRSYGSNFIEYGSKEVLSEIQALNDLGIDEWMLWNAASRYPELGGVKDEKEFD